MNGNLWLKMSIEILEPNERLSGPGVKQYNFFFVGQHFLLLLMNVETSFDVTYPSSSVCNDKWIYNIKSNLQTCGKIKSVYLKGKWKHVTQFICKQYHISKHMSSGVQDSGT